MLKTKYLHRSIRKSEHNRSWKSRKYNRGKNLDIFSDLPKRQRIGREYGGWGYNYDTTPLDEFIESKIGKNWNDVYSEILTKIKNKYRYSIDNYLKRYYIDVPIYDEDYIPKNTWGRMLNDTTFVDMNNILVNKTKDEILSDAKRYKRKKKLLEILENAEKDENNENESEDL